MRVCIRGTFLMKQHLGHNFKSKRRGEEGSKASDTAPLESLNVVLNLKNKQTKKRLVAEP